MSGRARLLWAATALLTAALAALLVPRPRPSPEPLPDDGRDEASRRALTLVEELRSLPPGSALLRVPPGALSATYTSDAPAPPGPPGAPRERRLLADWTVELLRFDPASGDYSVVAGGSRHQALRVVVRVREAPSAGAAGADLGLSPVLARLTLHRLAGVPGAKGS